MQSSLKNKPSYTFKKASFLKRLASFYLATILIIFLSYLFSYLMTEMGILGFTLYSKSFWTLFTTLIFLGFLTDEFFKAILTFNLAYLILGLRLVDERDFTSIGFSRALFRTAFAFLSFLFGGLGFIAILFNREKLSMHDMLVHSNVVDLSDNLFTRIISALSSFLIALPGVLVTISFLFVVISSPLFLWSSVKDYENQKTIELAEWFDKPRSQYSISLHEDAEHHKITFLITDTGAYHDNFKVLPNYQESTVDIKSFDIKSNLKKIKFDLKKFLDSRDFLKSFYLKFDKIVFKTTANYDLSIRNPKFFLAYENVIGDDLLSTFDYNLVEQEDKLDLTISNNLGSILKDAKLSYLLKSEYIKSVYYIDSQWTKFLYDLDINEKAALMPESKKLSNKVRIIIDPDNGYIKQFDIIHPGENTLFNRITNRFLNDLQFKILDPKDLSPEDVENNILDITLVYKEVI